MKKIAGLIIILAVLVLGGYYGMGVITESTIKRNILVMNRTNGVVADVTQYQRGLFCSEATIKWALHVPEQVEKDANGQAHVVPAQDYAFETPIKISHGPIIFADHSVRFGMGYAQSKIPLPEKYNKQLDEKFTSDSAKPQLDLSIFVSYLNRTAFELSLPSFKLTAKEDKSVIDWKGMESKTSMTSDLGKISGSLEIEGLSVSNADNNLVLGKITSEYDLHKTAADLYLGDANFAVPSIEFTAKGQKVFAVNEFAFETGSDIESDLFSAHMVFELKSLFANGQDFGPGTLKVAIRNLDATVLAKIHAQTTAAQQGSEMERQQALLALIPELPKLFSKGAEFEISRLAFKMPQGTIEGDLKVSLPAGANSDPFAMMQNIQGEAKLKMPKTLVKQMMEMQIAVQMAKTPEMQKSLTEQLQSQSADKTVPTEREIASMQADKQLSGLEQSGLLTVVNTDYVVEISLQQGKLVVNGKAFDPSMLKF